MKKFNVDRPSFTNCGCRGQNLESTFVLSLSKEYRCILCILYTVVSKCLHRPCAFLNRFQSKCKWGELLFCIKRTKMFKCYFLIIFDNFEILKIFVYMYLPPLGVCVGWFGSLQYCQTSCSGHFSAHRTLVLYNIILLLTS